MGEGMTGVEGHGREDRVDFMKEDLLYVGFLFFGKIDRLGSRSLNPFLSEPPPCRFGTESLFSHLSYRIR